MLAVKLKHLDDWNARRRAIAALYTDRLGDAGLVLMRERVVLYSGAIATASPKATGSIIDQAARLDMQRVHLELEQERLSQASLFERRVCPTARRGPFTSTGERE